MAKGRADHLAIAVAALGMSSIAAQIILLREFLSVFYGNELVLGIVLANWMVLTGGGAVLGRMCALLSSRRAFPAVALIALGVIPLLTVLSLRLFRNSVFTPGSMIGIAQALISSFVVLAPYCLLSGFLFVFFASSFSERMGTNSIAAVYSWEAAGSAIGGVLFSVALGAVLDAFQALALVLVIDLGLAVVVAHRQGVRRVRTLAGLLLVCALAFVFTCDADALTRRFLFPGQEVVRFKDTPYGNLTITRQGGQMNFFENNVLMFSTNNVTSNEETVHYAMLQHRAPHRVLLIGGGISGTTHEILKYGVDRIDYVEVNPWVITLGRGLTSALDDGRIRVINADARMYVRETSERYDAALVDLPDPGTAQLNRYYTLEFFQELRRVLRDSAVVSISLLPSADYQGSEARRVSSVLFATLGRTFAHVLIVPGERNYFLASDGPLDVHICKLVEARKISTVYVNRYYLDDPQIEERSVQLTGSLDSNAALNTDFHPVCYYRQLAYWLSYFGFDPGPWIVLGALAAVCLLAWFSPIGTGVFAAGFAASSLEMILLVAFQTIYGSLYAMTGIVITAFMAGLAAGSFLSRRFARGEPIDRFVAVQMTLSAVCIVLSPILLWIRTVAEVPLLVHALFTALAFAVAALIGTEFGLASAARPGSPREAASELYGLDLVGSALGALIVSVYGIPLLGLALSSQLAGAICAGGGLFCLLLRRRYLLHGV